MTREEAKDVLRNAAWLGTNSDRERIEEAVRMAIEALSADGDTISRKKTLERLTNISYNLCKTQAEDKIIEYAKTMVITMPSVQPEIIRCKDCKHQEKFWYGDKRRKDGGYYICGCELAEGYSHVCLDDDFCSRAEMRVEHEDN